MKYLGCFAQALLNMTIRLVEHSKDITQGGICPLIISALSYERSPSALVYILDLCTGKRSKGISRPLRISD